MKNIRKKFENETKTRINIISADSSRKINIQQMLVKQGIFNIKEFSSGDSFNYFPTEILCASTKSNIISIYLSIKKSDDIFKDIKEIILKSVYEASLIIENENI